MKKGTFHTIIASVIAAIIIGLLHAPSAVAETYIAEGAEDGTKWVLTQDGELLISGNGAMIEPAEWRLRTWEKYKDQVLKATIEKGITTIAPRAFSNCVNLREVSIPEGITKVGTEAFCNCYAIESITLPEGVQKIGGQAFRNCFVLTYIFIPKSVTNIGVSPFDGCGIADLSNNYYCREIERYAYTLGGVTFTLHVEQGSYAEEFAIENEYAYDNESKRNPGRLEKIIEKADEIINECIKSDMTEKQKAKALHDWIVYHAYYGGDATKGCILLEGAGACGDYAEAYAILLSKVGIRNSLVHGSVHNGIGHYWNYVCIDGIWYHVDTTFDDPGENNGKRSGYERSTYFLMTDEEIGKDHISDGHEFDIEVYPEWQCQFPKELHHQH